MFPKTEKERPGLKKLFIINCPIAICDGVLRSMFYFIIKQIKALAIEDLCVCNRQKITSNNNKSTKKPHGHLFLITK